MRRYFEVWIVVMLFSTSLFSQNLQLIRNFGHNKGNLKAYIYKSPLLDTSKPIPLVVVLHGCNQTAKSIALATDWNKLADSLNFMVLYPEQRNINNINKCFNFFIGFKAKRDKGEVLSIKNMITYAVSHYSIDASRIYITGMSAGGGMANAMLNVYPELFAAGALIESPSVLVSPLDTTSTKIPKVAIFQGTRDIVVWPRNADGLVRQWLKKNKIEASSVDVKAYYLGNKNITAYQYYDGNKNLKVIKLLLAGVGHQLCIDVGDDLKHGGKKGLFTTDIDFFSTYWIAGFFGLLPESKEKKD